MVNTLTKDSMVRIKILKDFDVYTRDEIIEVSANIAHGLIDSGWATIYIDSLKYQDKEMRKGKKVNKKG